MIQRSQIGQIIQGFDIKRIAILYGARQVGKTTIMQSIIKTMQLETVSLNGDDLSSHRYFEKLDANALQLIVGDAELICIDEAQRIPNIGLALKILHDQFPHLLILVTGSSSFDIMQKVSEPLTGRVLIYQISPFSLGEIATARSLLFVDQQLEEYMIYGLYPNIYLANSHNTKQLLLGQLADSYLLKDIFLIESIKYSNKIRDLLKLLAFQIGQEVSLTELATQLQLSRETIDKYMYMLEKAFIIFRLSGFSRNLRKEITKMDKVYFYDLGIRNILIDNCKPLSERNDKGQLRENFMLIERYKYHQQQQTRYSKYFWRIYTGAELDYLEEYDNMLYGYEFKFMSKSSKIPKSFAEEYKNTAFLEVHRENWREFLGM